MSAFPEQATAVPHLQIALLPIIKLLLLIILQVSEAPEHELAFPHLQTPDIQESEAELLQAKRTPHLQTPLMPNYYLNIRVIYYKHPSILSKLDYFHICMFHYHL